MPTPTALTVGVPTVDALSYGDVDVHEYTAAQTVNVTATITAERLPAPSDLDSVLIIWNPATGLVGYNDDLGVDTLDSEVAYDQTTAETYWVVVDAFIYEGGRLTYQLDVDTSAP